MVDSLIAFLLTLVGVFFSGAEINEVSAPVAIETAVVERVVDGDTIYVRLNGQIENVRYIGVDTPEPYRDGDPACYSKEATKANRLLVEGKTVRLESDAENKDRYDRLLRYVYVDDVFVQEELLRGGFATTLVIKPNTSHAQQFKTLETEAKKEERGLWGECPK